MFKRVAIIPYNARPMQSPVNPKGRDAIRMDMAIVFFMISSFKTKSERPFT